MIKFLIIDIILARTTSSTTTTPEKDPLPSSYLNALSKSSGKARCCWKEDNELRLPPLPKIDGTALMGKVFFLFPNLRIPGGLNASGENMYVSSDSPAMKWREKRKHRLE